MLLEFRKINSMTKYPSILTYHQIGERGMLSEKLSKNESFPLGEKIYIYEKIDGENSRIILLNKRVSFDYFIGSREEILFAKGDRIGNPYGNISDLLIPTADKLNHIFKDDKDTALIVIYLESYGGKTKEAKNYTMKKTQSYKVFDIFSLNYDEFNLLIDLPLEKIAIWRDNGGQPFYNEQQKQDFINKWNLLSAPLLEEVDCLPWSIEDIYNYLCKFKETKVGIDIQGKSEGIVVRTEDRSMIRKIRFEDYERTLGLRGR